MRLGLGKVIGEADSETADHNTKLDPDLLNNLTQAGVIKGTPGYMAPEQTVVKGEKSFQTDIYALGCLLYSILTYKTTVSGSIEEMIEATQKGLIHLPSKVCPEFFLSKTLDGIFEKATELKAENRYTSVKLLKKDVSNFLAGYSTSVEKGLFMHEIGLFYRRNKTACWTAMSLTLVMFVVTLLFIFNLNRRIKEADTANKIASHMSSKQLEEQDKYDKSFNRISSKFFQKVKLMDQSSFYSDPVKTTDISIQSLNDLLSSGARDKEILDYKLKCLLIKMDLNSVQALAPEKHPLKEVCKRYAPMIHESTLPQDELVNFVLDLSDLELIEKLLTYQAVSKPEVDLSESVLVYLLKLNPDCNKDGLKYIAAKKELYINCPKIRLITNSSASPSGKSVLRFLELKKIDFSGSGIKKFQASGEFQKVELVFDP